LPKETYINSTCLTGIKKVAIVTSVSSPEVSYSIYNTSIPGGLAGFFASCIEGAIRSGVDHAHAAKISEHSDTSRNESNMAQSFIQVLKKGNYFQVIDYANDDNNRDESKLSNTGYDAVIRLIVQEILLEKTAAEYMSLTARVRGELEKLKSREILWTRDEIVINPEPHTLDYYKENGLKELDTMLEKAVRNLAYDFLYLK
jgi:hypothetical protein